MDSKQVFSCLLGATLTLSWAACAGGGGGDDESGTTGGVTATTSSGETDSVSGSSTSDGPTGISGTDTSESGTTGTTGTSGTDTDCSFLECDTGGDDGGLCDVWAQDCPDGEKCMPYAADGGSAWDANKCTPIDPAPDSVGSECTVEINGVSGIDSCGPRSMCWDVDPETNIGICVAMCEGSMESATCQAGTSCAILNDGVLILCLPNCDPLVQDCAGDDTCLPSDESFICVLDASGPEVGAYGDPCEYANGCDPGLYCLPPEYIADCPAAGCCTPWCDIEAPNDCPGGTQECIPWFEEGTAPPGYETVGICGIPQ